MEKMAWRPLCVYGACHSFGIINLFEHIELSDLIERDRSFPHGLMILGYFTGIRHLAQKEWGAVNLWSLCGSLATRLHDQSKLRRSLRRYQTGLSG